MALEVEVRLFAALREGRFKRRACELPDSARLGDLLRQLEIAPEQVSLPLVNGRNVEMDQELAGEDVVSLFPSIGGG